MTYYSTFKHIQQCWSLYFGIILVIHFLEFGIDMARHFDSWAARPYQKLSQVTPPRNQCTNLPAFASVPVGIRDNLAGSQVHHGPYCVCNIPSRFLAYRTVYRVLFTDVPA